MGIIRVHSSTEHIVSINRRALTDDRLSFRARGLLAYLMTKPPDWRISYRHLMRVAPEGQHAILGALNNLGECGYVTRATQRKEKGRWDWIYDIFDHPDEHRAEVFHARMNHARITHAVRKPKTKPPSSNRESKGKVCEKCKSAIGNGCWCEEEAAS